jgi:hypothetical protein
MTSEKEREMNWHSVRDWLGEKTTIVGISCMAGSAAAWALHVVDPRQAAVGAVVGLVAALLRESPGQVVGELRQFVGEAQAVAFLPAAGNRSAPGADTVKTPPGG